MTTDSAQDDIPIISGDAVGFDMRPRIPEDEERFTFSTVCRSNGLSSRLIISGYTQGSFPWPDAKDADAGLYPWGRLFPCTILKTGRVNLTHSMRRRVRDAVHRHYSGLELEILLDYDFDEVIEAIAEYHRKRSNGTWMTRDMIDMWKALHRQRIAHCVSVHIDGELAGGLYFTSVGRMLYGESMFSLRPDASKLALAALAAFAESVYSEYAERTPNDLTIVHEQRFAHAGGMLFHTLAIDGTCNYYEDGRRSTMEVIPLASTDPRVTPMYNRLIEAGFRRDSTYLYRLACNECRRCIPTRIDVHAFRPDDTMRRTMKRNASLVMRELKLAPMTEEQYELYKRYQDSRHRRSVMADMDRSTVSTVLFSTCSDTRLLEFRTSPDAPRPNELKMVCIIDCLDNALSAVYTFFDPDVPKLSLGTFGILSEIEYARRNGLSYVYLGMDYKTRFQPMDIFWENGWMPERKFTADPKLLDPTSL